MEAWKNQGGLPSRYVKKLNAYRKAKARYDKKHPQKSSEEFTVIGAWELANYPFPPSRVSYDSKCVYIHVDENGYVYPIAWYQIENTKEGIIGWIAHLCEKDWADGELIRDFLGCVCKHFKINVQELN